jgi:hypothetical protein
MPMLERTRADSHVALACANAKPDRLTRRTGARRRGIALADDDVVRVTCLVVLGACAAPGFHGGVQLAGGTDGRVVVQLAAGGDGGFTSGDLKGANAFILLAGEGKVGIDVRTREIVGAARLGVGGWAHQHPDSAWGHRGMLGYMGRFSRKRSTMGVSVEYWGARVLAATFDPGLCMNEGSYRFHTLESGVAVDVGWDKQGRVVTATVGSHYRWSGWAHVHPFTDCPGSRNP